MEGTTKLRKSRGTQCKETKTRHGKSKDKVIITDRQYSIKDEIFFSSWMSKQKIKSKVYYYKRKWRRSPTTPLFHSLFSLLSITLNWDKRKISWRRCTSTSNPILSYLLLASFGKHFVYDLLFLVNFIRWSPSQRSETDLRFVHLL